MSGHFWIKHCIEVRRVCIGKIILTVTLSVTLTLTASLILTFLDCQFDRFLYIVSSQNCESMAGHFWIKQCIEVQVIHICNMMWTPTLPDPNPRSSVWPAALYCELPSTRSQLLDFFWIKQCIEVRHRFPVSKLFVLRRITLCRFSASTLSVGRQERLSANKYLWATANIKFIAADLLHCVSKKNMWLHFLQ